MNEKFKEFLGFLLCFASFVYIMEHFDFRSNIFSDILFKNSTSMVKKTTPTRFKNHSVSNIPSAVYRGSQYSGIWVNVLHNDKKVVFYVKDKEDTLFNKKVDLLLSADSFSQKYDVYAFKPDNYRSYKRSVYSSKKICNTLKECNLQRKNASNYTEMVYFFDKCAKKMCIINPKKKQYVLIRSRDYKDVLKTLSNFANW